MSNDTADNQKQPRKAESGLWHKENERVPATSIIPDTTTDREVAALLSEGAHIGPASNAPDGKGNKRNSDPQSNGEEQ
jgi:hypothetical protein